MPKYDYKCPSCGSVEEVEHSMSEDPLIECGDCFTTCVKLFSTPAVRFKGQGWGGVYRTFKPKKDS